MRIFKIVRVCYFFFILSSGRHINYSGNKIEFPSKKYYVIATINRSGKSKNDYADIVINLYNSNEKLYSLNSKAGDFNKWALGWNKFNDTVILDSSDIGNLAWEIKNYSFKPVQFNEELNKRANELYFFAS